MKQIYQFLTVTIILLFLFSFKYTSETKYSFSSNQKEATKFTKDKNESMYDLLDFKDSTDFLRVNKGFMAPLLNNGDIEGTFQATEFNFIQNRKAPESVNPSLWRHAQLVNKGGLYKVIDNIYQVRGQDLVNLTVIETENGIVLYDVEYTAKTLENSIKLYEKHRGKRPLKAVIISHSHVDHFGGFKGIYLSGLASPEDFSSGKIPLIAPLNFVEKAVSENVMAGTIMSKRAGYQYGNVLSPGEKGLITGALGTALADGPFSVPIPNRIVSDRDGETITIDGVTFDFYYTPDAEAPAEMIMYIPQWKALSMAEEVNHLQHNIYSLRGAEARDAKVWAAYIAQSIVRFGDEVEVQFGPHTWPVWGNNEVVEYLKNQRDLYQSIYNTTLRYSNYGYKPNEIAESAELPESVFNKWSNRPYYGHTGNNIKSTYIRNLGWFNGNSAKLATYPDAEKGRRYVQAMGGEETLLSKALGFYEQGDYRFTIELLNNIIAYKATNTQANLLMADAFEQLGYQEENALYRNWYLCATNELRVGGNITNNLNATSPEIIASLPADLLLNYLGMLINQKKAQNIGNYTINLNLTDGPNFNVELHNGVLHVLEKYSAPNPDLVLSMSKVEFINLLFGKISPQQLNNSKGSSIKGNTEILGKLKSVVDFKIKNNMNLVLPLQKENRIQ